MGDHYAYNPKYFRPRSPVLYHPGRTSLPNVGYDGYISGYGGAPSSYGGSRRDIPPHPRSSGERLAVTGPVTTTTYKVKPSSSDMARSNSLQTPSRSRSATVDSSSRPVSVPQAPRLRPVIHSGTGRPASPISNPYRASDTDALYVPASSHHHRGGHHRSTYSTDHGAEYRTRNRDGDYLRSGSGRESAIYTSSRGRPPSSYSTALVTASDDYADASYGFANARELAHYDADHKARHSRHRRDSSESRSRPTNAMSIADLGAKSFDARERGPPPSTRHRDKILAPRATMDVPTRPRVELGYESDSRSKKARPVSMYQERDLQRSHRDANYGARETEVRERTPREKSHHHSRHDDDDRQRNSERHGEKKEHKSGRDSLAALGLAAASAFGIGAATQSKENDWDDRDEPPRRTRDDSDEERRRRRRAEDREPLNSGSRNTREKGYTREAGRGSPPHERDSHATRDVEYKREAKDRHLSSQSPPREKRSSPPIASDSRPRHETATVIDHPKEEKSKNRSRSRSASTHSDDFSSGERDQRSRREQERTRAELPPTPTTPSTAFNPKDAMGLRALKEQLNRQEEPKEVKRPSIASMAVAGVGAGAATAALSSRERTYDSREDDRGRRDLIDETQPPKELREPHHQIRVVSPPRETQIAKIEEKPVKGILRAPREKFPEDPQPLREGVAPLKDAKKDGVPPNARWTKISRHLVNPAALEAGKERYEEDDDFVTVLRVLAKEEIEQYATITESIRTAREEEAERERQKQRRRERHDRHKRERAEHPETRNRRSHRRREEESESDTTEEDDRDNDHVKTIEAPDAPRPRRIAFEDYPMMSGGLGDLKENLSAPGTFTGYTRSPPAPQSLAR